MKRATLVAAAAALGGALAGPRVAQAQTPTQPPPEPPPAAGSAPEIGLGQPAAPAPSATAPAPSKVVVNPPGGAPDKPKAQYENVWYGWQTVVADGAAVGLFLLGSAIRQPSVQWVGYGTFVLAPGIVHIVHGGIGKAFGSMAMRLLLPPVTVGIGALIGLIAAADSNGANSSGDPLVPTKGNLKGAGLGAFVGLAAGVFICTLADAAVLGFEKQRVDGGSDEARRRKALEPSFAVVPVLAPNTQGLGVVGRF